MTKRVWSHVYKYLHARQIPHQMSFPSQTIPDCIRLVSFAVTLNHRQTFLFYINTLACVKAEIWPMIRNLHFSYIVQNRSGIVMFTYSIVYEY